MSLLSLVPLFMTLAIVIGAIYMVVKRKALAQAHCVHEGVTMQLELKASLEKLVKLNREATRLRAQRLKAERALAAALASANPPAIAATRAARRAVILAQTALSARQTQILLEARRQRQRGHRELVAKVRPLRAGAVDSREYYWRPLAVEARPADSLTPDFEPVTAFARMQQHRFKFDVNLAPPFALAQAVPALRQTTECAVTLTGKDNSWTVQILAASAPLRSP